MAGLPHPAPVAAGPAPAGWTVVAATLRGEAHARRGERGQDALRALAAGPGGAALVAAVADGAGSAPRGGAGAALAVRAAARAARAALAGGRPVADLAEDEAAGWGLAAREALAAAAAARGLPLRDLACTLIVAAVDATGALVAHVGDGAAAARGADGAWVALSWPEGGEHAGETRFLTEDPPALRTARAGGPPAALALLTDGIERLVLDFAARAPHAPFFDRMTGPLAGAGAGRDAALSAALRLWLGGEGVAARTDDDRTLLLAAPCAR
jgi:hypothetical protein